MTLLQLKLILFNNIFYTDHLTPDDLVIDEKLRVCELWNIFWIYVYFKGRNFRGKKLSRIFLAKSRKILPRKNLKLCQPRKFIPVKCKIFQDSEKTASKQRKLCKNRRPPRKFIPTKYFRTAQPWKFFGAAKVSSRESFYP